MQQAVGAPLRLVQLGGALGDEHLQLGGVPLHHVHHVLDERAAGESARCFCDNATLTCA